MLANVFWWLISIEKAYLWYLLVPWPEAIAITLHYRDGPFALEGSPISPYSQDFIKVISKLRVDAGFEWLLEDILNFMPVWIY